MESLKEYFRYNKNYDELPRIFYNISEKLKDLHDKNKCVDSLSADSIILNSGNVEFLNTIPFSDLKRLANLKAFSLLMLGTYFTLSSDFRDFSGSDENWVKNNFYEIQGMLRTTTIPSEFLERSIMSGVFEYYHNYQDLENSLLGKDSSKAMTKVLRKSSYSLAYEPITSEEEFEKKSAFGGAALYPAILIILIVILIVFLLINYL